MRIDSGPNARITLPLAAHRAGELRHAPPEPVLGRPRIAFDQAVAVEGGQQAEGCRAVNAELAGDLRAGAPAFLGEQVQDGDGPIHRADDRAVPGHFLPVAHGATLYVGVNCCWALSICWAMRNNTVN